MIFKHHNWMQLNGEKIVFRVLVNHEIQLRGFRLYIFWTFIVTTQVTSREPHIYYFNSTVECL